MLEAGRAVLDRRDERELGHPVRGLLHGGGALLPAARGVRRAPRGAGARALQEDHVAYGQMYAFCLSASKVHCTTHLTNIRN